MSLVDSRYPELDLFLQRWQQRLNRRLFVGSFLLGTIAATPVAVAGALMADDLGVRVGIAAGIVATVALGATAWGLRRRLSRHQAASWLDERGQTAGLFRAASETLDQNQPGWGGLAVLQEANRRWKDLGGSRAPRMPRKKLALRGALALTLVVASGFVLVKGVPLSLPPRGSPEEARHTAPSDQPESGPGSRELTPKEAAKRLFPDDQRLAALAEQALSSGDPGALDTLLQQESQNAKKATQNPGKAKPNRSSQNDPSGQSGSPGNKAGDPSSRTEKGSGKNPGDQGAGTSPPENQGNGSRSQSSKKAPENQNSGKSSNQERRSGAPAPRGNQPPGQGSPEDQASHLGAGAPGDAHSTEKLIAEANPGTSEKRLSLKDKETEGVFEYILPGTESKLPTAQVLADSLRSAEAAIRRTPPPREFENTIREYFLSLSNLSKTTNSQEANP